MIRWRTQIYDTLPSTQDAACAAAREGQPGGLAILAHAQFAGRGSRGRRWHAPSGNLNLSVMVRPHNTELQPGAWALLAGVALHEAVSAELTEKNLLRLKWPNDLVLEESKLGGILIDSALTAQNTLDWIVIGLGVNITNAPHIEGRSTACLAHIAATPPAEALAERVLHQLALWMEKPFSETRAAWLERAHPIGTYLHVQTGQRRVQGRFAGLSAEGGLLLEGQNTPISTGEVFLAPLAHVGR